MAIVTLPAVRQAFFNGFKATAMETDKAATFNGKIIIDPAGQADLIAKINAAIAETAKEKWPQSHEKILAKLKADRKLCYSAAPYTNAKGEVYDGFEDMHYISWRNQADAKPPFYGAEGQVLTEEAGLVYGGGFVHAKIEFWAQEHKDYGLRINAKLLGGKFAKHGARFAGGAAPASADDFAGLASEFPDDGFGGGFGGGDDIPL